MVNRDDDKNIDVLDVVNCAQYFHELMREMFHGACLEQLSRNRLFEWLNG